jgi:putative PEP-CTERM system TPR-repeat lipoprotein
LPFSGLSIPLAALLLASTLTALAGAQDKPASGAPIDLDKELQASTPTDRARSYYYYSLSKWYEEKGDINRAVGEMHNALKYNDASASVRVALAELLEKSGDMHGALVEAQEAARIEPKNPEPHWLIANIYFRYQGRDRASMRDSLKKAVKELEEMRQDAPEDERSYFALGQAYLEMGEPDKAIAAYEKFQALVPNSDAGYVEIAEYYERLGEHDKAIDYLNKALKSQPDAPKSLMMLAKIYSGMDKNKEAVELYKKLLEVTGDNLPVKKQLAAALLDSQEFGEAKKLLEEIEKTAPTDRESQILLSRALLGLKEFDRAMEILNSILEDNPDHLEARFYLGTAYEQNGNPSEAAKIFAQLLEQTRGSAEEHKANRLVFQQHLAAAYQDLGENDKAIAIYEEILKNDPDPNPRLLFFLINAYRLNHQLDKALALGKQQYEKNRADTNFGLVYARTLADSGKTKEGAEILQKMLQADPSNVDIYVNLSQVYLQGKKYAEAEKILRRAEDRKLDSERLKFQLGTIYERQKDFDRAESLFKELLKEKPKNAIVLNYLGYMLADRGIRLDEAVKYVEEALTLEPNNGAYLDSLGWAFFKLNQLDKAEEYLLKAAEIVKNDPVIQDHLGDLYFKAGDLKKAHDFWSKSVTIGTEPEDTQKVREKLDKLQDTLRKQKH